MEASHPMFRFAPSGEVVVLLREQDHLGLLPVIPEGREELDRFDMPTTKVLEGVDQEERRRHVLHMPKRRLGQGGLLRSEEHTSELQSRFDLVCRLLLEKK